jgi:hypothetical protein
VKRKVEVPFSSPTADTNPWNNPIFRDVESFLTRIQTYIDIFGSAHVAIPRKKNKKFIYEIRQHGFDMEPIKPDPTSNLINKNFAKKLQFFSITKTRHGS